MSPDLKLETSPARGVATPRLAPDCTTAVQRPQRRLLCGGGSAMVSLERAKAIVEHWGEPKLPKTG
jgi:hypothetical protein